MVTAVTPLKIVLVATVAAAVVIVVEFVLAGAFTCYEICSVIVSGTWNRGSNFACIKLHVNVDSIKVEVVAAVVII